MDASDRQQRIETEAAEWWLALKENPSRADREQFVDWLRESSLHVAEMLRIAQLHGTLEQFERWSRLPAGGREETDDSVVTLAAPRADLLSARPARGTPTRRPRALGAMAAVLLVAMALGTILVIRSQSQIIQTDRGERRDVALADGSVVDLDPETRVRVRYEAKARYIFLERGRALFHVAKNLNRPFWVQAESTKVRAVGTAFSVDRERDSVVVTVAEGTVAVFPGRIGSAAAIPDTRAPRASMRRGGLPSQSRHGADLAQSAAGPAPASVLPRTGPHLVHAIYLTADQQITVDGAGVAQPIRRIDSSRALAWADGRLIFERESLADAVHEFNRYNRIQVRLQDASLAHRAISGVFNASDPDSFVAFIQTVTPVRVIRDDAGDITIESPE